MHTPRRLLAAVLGLPLACCGTIEGLRADFDPEGLACLPGEFVPRVYAGVFFDVAALRSESCKAALIWLDLPFSLVGDTLVLPWTLVTQLLYGNHCPPASKPPEGPVASEPGTD
ncbi:MAG TPA: YceK/YidQ family lipoprotein [Planctomycetota bacterium]